MSKSGLLWQLRVLFVTALLLIAFNNCGKAGFEVSNSEKSSLSPLSDNSSAVTSTTTSSSTTTMTTVTNTTTTTSLTTTTTMKATTTTNSSTTTTTTMKATTTTRPPTTTTSTSSTTTTINVNSAPLLETQFNQMFPQRNAFYSYASFVSALTAFPEAFKTGSQTIRLQELAAFFANVDHETGSLVYIREINQSNWPFYCDNQSSYACASGQYYYGRGPIQISWNYNYGLAGQVLGLPLLSDPDLVARDAVVAWKTALWFWMTQTGAGRYIPHEAVVNSLGFGETIRSINGALECNQPSGSVGNQQMQDRVQTFQRFIQIFGVSVGSNVGC